MTELILSDITRMGPGYCVIGLQSVGEGYCSVRPIPERRYSWPLTFSCVRGDRLQVHLFDSQARQPHVEDRECRGTPCLKDRISEIELVGCLRRAEHAGQLKELFGCDLQLSPFGGGAVWVSPAEAMRSICGCEFNKIRFRLFPGKLRAELSLPSDEVLRSLPVVDHAWLAFVAEAKGLFPQADCETQVQELLNSSVRRRILDRSERFARIGVARADKDGLCWLMLDSLFPQPCLEWLDGVGLQRARETGA